MGRPSAVSRWCAGLLAWASSAALAPAQSSDLIEGAQLGARGVVFQSAFSHKFESIYGGAGAGDVNGDGFSDLLLSVQVRPEEEADSIALLLILGRESMADEVTVPGDLPGTVRFHAAAQLRYPSFEGLAPAGDIDGDGLADFFVRLPYYPSEAGDYQGRGFLVFGSRSLKGGEDIAIDEPAGALRTVVFTSSSADHQGIGISMATIGDWDGDGKLDLAVGAPQSTNIDGEVYGGIVFILLDARSLPPVVDLAEVGKSIPGLQLHGNPEVLDPETAAQLGFDTSGDFGHEVMAAGDFDGDGLSDLLVSEPEPYPPPLYLFHGRRALPPVLDMDEAAGIENVTIFRGLPDGYLRGGAAGVGDVNRDGRADIVIGLPRHSYRPFVVGNSAAYLFHGSASFPKEVDLSGPPPPEAATTFHAIGFVDLFGAMVAPAGDLNGDGVPDFAVGVPWAAVSGRRNAGEAVVIFGKIDFGAEVKLADGFGGIRILGENTGNALGSRASPAGDFNGDGAQDLLVLGRQQGIAEDSSRAYLIYGTGSGPAPLRLFRADPPQGPIRGGAVVILRGSGFIAEPRVLFGGNPSGSVRVVSGSELRVVAPPAERPGAVDVTLTLGGESRTLAAGFEYTPDFPAIDVQDPGEHGLVLEWGENITPHPALAFGDVTGDGADDLVAGGSNEVFWTVTVVRGGPGLPPRLDALAPSQRVSVISTQDPLPNEASVAFLGDVNKDGVGDFGIGLLEGLGYVVFGMADFPEALWIEDAVLGGLAVRLERGGLPQRPDSGLTLFAPAGDVTGDGIGDFALAFSRASGFAPDAGEVLVIAGRRAWPEELPLDSPVFVLSRIQGTSEGDRLGRELSRAGDVNGDGFPDFLAAARSGAGKGLAYVLYGGPGLPADLDADEYVLEGGGVRIDIADGFQHFHWFDVAPAGDTDGDGFGDFLIGVEDGGESNHGVAYLIRGSEDLPGSLRLVEEPDAPDGITRIFGASPMVQAGRAGPAGDFNADGLGDFLIGQQPDLGESPSAPWKLFVMLGSGELPGSIDLSRPGRWGLEVPGERTAQVFLPCREAGDLNADGQPDFAIADSIGIDGSPGKVYVVFGRYGGAAFRRGDANFDERLEISDAIFSLAYLFLGGEAPRCEDAADSDDDGRILLTDAVFFLNHLFLGGPRPPDPYPDPGIDSTEDVLSCRGF